MRGALWGAVFGVSLIGAVLGLGVAILAATALAEHAGISPEFAPGVGGAAIVIIICAFIGWAKYK